MSLYHDSEYPIREAITTAHDQTLVSFSAPGGWWSGAERAAIVAQARDARCEADLQERTVAPTDVPAELPEAARRVARQVAVSTNDLDRGFCDQALKDGLSDVQYTEIVGIVSRASAVDVFARGIGLPSRTLGTPVDGEPTRVRPQTARAEGAWVESIPGGRSGKREAIETYGSDAVEAAPFIYRALSLVPEEAQGLILLGTAQYITLDEFMNLDFTFDPDITRRQVELVASRVSAINQCFY